MRSEDSNVRAASGRNHSAIVPIIFLVINLFTLLCSLLLGWALADYFHRIAFEHRPLVWRLISILPLTCTFGFVGAVVVSEKYRHERSRGIALVGLWLSIICIPAYIYGVLLNPIVYRAKATQATCLSNMKQLGLAMMMYAENYDGHLPPAENWNKALSPVVSPGNPSLSKVLRCPEFPDDAPPSYALNRYLAGRSLKGLKFASEIPMLFESVPGYNQRGDWSLLPNRPRHNGGYIVGFADGHATWISKSRIKDYKLDPEQVIPGHPSEHLPKAIRR